MKALSLLQPWGSLIAHGHKTIEGRTWFTDYRGPLLICASKKFGPEERQESAMFAAKFPDMPPPRRERMPLGLALCIADLVDCRLAVPGDEKLALWEFAPRHGERYFSWVLANVRQVNPFPVRGELGLYEVDVPAAALEVLL